MIGTDEIAARLTKARADRAAIGSLSAELGDFDLAAAYEVQRVLRREAGALARGKLGVPPPAQRRRGGARGAGARPPGCRGRARPRRAAGGGGAHPAPVRAG